MMNHRADESQQRKGTLWLLLVNKRTSSGEHVSVRDMQAWTIGYDVNVALDASTSTLHGSTVARGSHISA